MLQRSTAWNMPLSCGLGGRDYRMWVERDYRIWVERRVSSCLLSAAVATLWQGHRLARAVVLCVDEVGFWAHAFSTFRGVGAESDLGAGRQCLERAVGVWVKGIWFDGCGTVGKRKRTARLLPNYCRTSRYTPSHLGLLPPPPPLTSASARLPTSHCSITTTHCRGAAGCGRGQKAGGHARSEDSWAMGAAHL